MEKLAVDLIGPYKIRGKGKDLLILKYVTMIDHVTGWFEVTQYNGKKAMTITNLVETMWLVQFPEPLEIMYNQGGKFLGHEFKNILIEQEYVIKIKPHSSGNPQVNAIIEIIHQLLGNLIRYFNLHYTYVHDADPQTGILAAASFAVQATYHRTKIISDPISIWPRHDPTNQSSRELDISTSA